MSIRHQEGAETYDRARRRFHFDWTINPPFLLTVLVTAAMFGTALVRGLDTLEAVQIVQADHTVRLTAVERDIAAQQRDFLVSIEQLRGQVQRGADASEQLNQTMKQLSDDIRVLMRERRQNP